MRVHSCHSSGTVSAESIVFSLISLLSIGVSHLRLNLLLMTPVSVVNSYASRLRLRNKGLCNWQSASGLAATADGVSGTNWHDRSFSRGTRSTFPNRAVSSSTEVRRTLDYT